MMGLTLQKQDPSYDNHPSLHDADVFLVTIHELPLYINFLERAVLLEGGEGLVDLGE